MNQQPEEEVFHARLDLKLWARVFRHALPYKRYLYPLIMNAAFLALCDASFALVTRWAIDDVVTGKAGSLWPYALVYFGLTTALAIGVWHFIEQAGNISSRMSHDIRRDCFERLQELEFAYFDHRPTGWLISRLTSDCNNLARIIAWGCLDVVWAGSLVLAIAIILLILNLQLGLWVLSVVPALVLISAWFQKRLLLSSRQTRKYNSLITASFTEELQGLKTTKTLVREAENLAEFEQLSEKMFQASLRNALQSAAFLPIVLTIGSIAAGLVLWRGGLSVLSGTLSLGTLVAFIFYSGQFFNPINQLAHVLIRMQGAQAAGERVLSLLATRPQIVDSPAVLEKMKAQQGQSGSGVAIDGGETRIETIQFRAVDFEYESGELILDQFNLTVKAGETIALVGPSGGGKSTIVSLLSRFYEPVRGSIEINGLDYRERSLDWYQSNLGIVLQSPHLFSGTIRENIRYGRLEATDEEVEEAARMVNADGFIRKLEQGYESSVGEGGNRLSTGEKQLLSFARAILANPQIFIMDEATSSIDTETEAKIQDGLKKVFAGRISFVIAHRLSTIRAADRILVIEKGKIIESGTHRSLLALRGAYYRLYTRQFEENAIELEK